MGKIILTEEQLMKLKEMLSENSEPIKEDKDGNYMAKQQLFTIGTLALQMWEILEEDETVRRLDGTKLVQLEQSIVSVVKDIHV